MMLLHEKPPLHKEALWETHEQPVERCGHPDTADFDSYRLSTDRKSFRISPCIPGLSLLKLAIVAARCRHLISVRFAQRLVDLSKCWEA
jgi:hypothetical protein